MKKAFTIVELLMVIAVISVLMGIVMTATSGSLRASRRDRARALCQTVQVGLSSYYAQRSKWPVDSLNNSPAARNAEGPGYRVDPNIYALTMKETHDAVRELVEQTKRGNPLIDVSALFVSTDDGKYGQKCWGKDFLQAATIKGMSNAKGSGGRELNNGRRLTVANMKFGYPEERNAYFRHFKILYSIPGDDLTVSVQDTDATKARYYDQ